MLQLGKRAAAQWQRHFSTASRGGKKFNAKSSGNNQTKSNGGSSEPTIAHHFAKTIITYSVPLLLFAGVAMYSKADEVKKESLDQESIGTLFRRALKGEKVWEELGPRKEYIKVTRLNDRLNNYRFCLEQPSGKRLAEEHIRHAEAMLKLRDTGLIDSVQQKLKTANISKADLSRLEEAETKYRASIRASQAEMDSALRQFRSHSLDIVTLGDTGDPKALREALRKDVERDGGRFTKALDQQLQAEQLYMAQVSSVLSEGERASLKKFLSKAAPGLAASYLYQEPPVSLAVLAGLPPVNDADASSSPNTATDTRSFADVQLATEPPRMYVLRFDGDAMASQVRRLREEVTAILQQSDPARGDSVVLRLNSSGGTVTGYGLAASQLQRLKQAQLPLTVCVDEVAASGGYMMACVADEICASPFAAVGSIGVVATSPNVYERLKREGVAVTDITAGEFKRTLAPYKEVDERDARKVQQDVVALHRSFQQFVLQQRPGLKDRIAQVATGEVWYGAEAVERGLVDRIRTVDDVLLDRLKAHSRVEILQLQYVGDKIEAREERDQFGRWVGEGAGVADGGLLDQCLGWVGRRLVGHLLSAVSAEGALSTSVLPLGGSADHISAAATGLKSTPPMVRDDRFGY